ncbi:hypothetical protein [Paenibacillus dokdonensis]|uniref:hypothetical protein n=1 Tax=Paenibacillus dokdonensis TaxID=2567944 RepID=UPI003D273EF9
MTRRLLRRADITAGGPVVGWIGNRFSIRTSILSAGILMLPVLAVFGRIIRKRI